MARNIEDIKNGESARLSFVAGRDGFDAVRPFAAQTYRLYRECLRSKKTGKPTPYGRAYREELIGSCVVFRRVLRSK